VNGVGVPSHGGRLELDINYSAALDLVQERKSEPTLLFEALQNYQLALFDFVEVFPNRFMVDFLKERAMQLVEAGCQKRSEPLKIGVNFGSLASSWLR